jgi:glutathione S-transferase
LAQAGSNPELSEPVLYGPGYSVYVRAARLALEEKGVAYRLVEFDILGDYQLPDGYLARHPFGLVPAFEHEGFSLYETGAITRYVDEAFPGPALQPAEPAARARMNQVVGIIDNYGYRPMVRTIFVQGILAPRRGEEPDEARISAAVAKAATCLEALDGLLGEKAFFAGEDVTLADLHAAPMFALFLEAPEGRRLMAERPGLERWWSRVDKRVSMERTRTSLD